MPNKYAKKKGWKLKKQCYKITNWHDYNQALRNRGDIEFWIAEDIVEQWVEPARVYDGTGAPKKFSDFAIITCHELRQIYKLPLRQTQGFLNAIFRMKAFPLLSPDYSCLSKRLSSLGIKTPRYKKGAMLDEEIGAIALDSTGLKCFGKDEWQQEKYKISGKRSWRKLHIAVDDNHIIHACELTDSFTSDDQVVETLAEQIEGNVEEITADGAYDKNHVYETLSDYFPGTTIIIPPKSNAVYDRNNHAQRNRNLQEIKTFGKMNWQRVRNYGKRNDSELAIQRYKKILGNKLHAREFSRQANEAMIGCGVLNKITSLGMPKSYRAA